MENHDSLRASSPHAISRIAMVHLSLLVHASLAVTTLAASLTQVSNFGNNPSSIQMFTYVPDKRATNPAVVVSVRSSVDFAKLK